MCLLLYFIDFWKIQLNITNKKKAIWIRLSLPNVVNEGAGLWQFNRSAVNIKKCITKVNIQDNEMSDQKMAQIHPKILWKAIFNVIAPQPSAVTQVAIANAKNNVNMPKQSKGKSW